MTQRRSPLRPRNEGNTTVSEFSASGAALSPDRTSDSAGGYSEGGISWPQGIVSDLAGNIWIANCANNRVTRYAGGLDIATDARGEVFGEPGWTPDGRVRRGRVSDQDAAHRAAPAVMRVWTAVAAIETRMPTVPRPRRHRAGSGEGALRTEIE